MQTLKKMRSRLWNYILCFDLIMRFKRKNAKAFRWRLCTNNGTWFCESGPLCLCMSKTESFLPISFVCISPHQDDLSWYVWTTLSKRFWFAARRVRLWIDFRARICNNTNSVEVEGKCRRNRSSNLARCFSAVRLSHITGKKPHFDDLIWPPVIYPFFIAILSTQVFSPHFWGSILISLTV